MLRKKSPGSKYAENHGAVLYFKTVRTSAFKSWCT